MYFTLLAILAFAAQAMGQALTINTPPSLVECQPAQITWSGGTSPFILAIIPGGETSAPSIETLSSSLTASPYTWVVNLPAGTNITLKITDATGIIQYSSPLVIQTGSTTCLNSNSSSSSAAASGSASSGSSAPSSTSSTTSAAASSSTTSAVSTAPSSAASSPHPSSAPASSAPASSAPAAASSTSHSGAMPTGIAALPALAAGVLGGLAVLF